MGAGPAGREVALGPEEIFFSTTDARGVIRSGNSVFARISGYALTELIDAPHNLVRHPLMPAGVFRLMWARLDAGQAVAAYVCNRSKTGDPYWVCAVISPLGDGFVSVRIAPSEPLLTTVREVYAEAAAVERAATREGMGRREVAGVGGRAIEDGLAARGFDTYDAFMRHALPVEIAARGHRVSEAHQRANAVGELAEVLAGTLAVADQLDALVGALDDYAAIGDRLSDAAGHVREMTHRLEGSVRAAQDASETVATSWPVLANIARVMAKPMTSATDALDALPPDFARLRSDIERMRFQVAMAALYDEMAAAFAAEVHDGRAPLESLGAVPLLCDATEGVAVEMSARLGRVNDDLAAVASRVGEAGALLEDFRRFLGQWSQLTARRPNTALRERVRPIDQEIAHSWQWTEQLRDLGRQASGAIVGLDRAALHVHLDSVRVPALLLALSTVTPG